MSDTALAQARALLDELTEAAKKGAIIPFRLPGQLEAVAALLAKAEAETPAPANGPALEMDDFLREQAAFISHAVHELRTPMTSIRGYSDMLSTPGMGDLNDMQQQFLSTIRVNARRMEGLLTDVSDMTKLRAGTLRLQVKMDMFKNIAMMIEKAARPLAAELGRELIFDIPQGLPILNVDGELLTKALVKLVENGLRYTPADGGWVKVSASNQDGNLLITVSDNGVGIAPEEIARLGEVYFRSENEVVRAYKGSGLGVPIAFGIIRLMNGSVSVSSQPGEGTTFTIVLPGLS
jgi:cell cycle sensor histidine kinase DivJ